MTKKRWMGADGARETTDNQHKYPITGLKGTLQQALDCQLKA